MTPPWFKCLLFCATLSSITSAAENTPSQALLIPAKINAALGAVRAGMTIDDVVKKFRAFYPEARMLEIAGGLATGTACIGLGGGVEISLRVRPTSDRQVWIVDDNSPIGILDYKKLQAIKVQLTPIHVIKTKTAEQGSAHQPTTRRESKF